MRKGFASNYRIVLLTVVVGLCLAGLGVRLVHLQVLDREALLKYVTKARQNIIVENARRGDILDYKGNILATSKTQIILGVDPQSLVKEDEGKWDALAQLIEMPLPELKRIFNTKYRLAAAPAATEHTPKTDADYVRFEFKLSDSPEKNEVAKEVLDNEPDANGQKRIRWAKLREDIEESVFAQIQKLKIKGVYGNRVYRRAYPHRSLAAHVIGYVNKEGVPASGIESYADFFLRGQDGWAVSEKDGTRRELPQFCTREVDPVDGYNVVLSIDTIIQNIVEDELKQIADKYHPLKATILVSDAHSGFLLGMANYPTFDLSEYNKADIASMRNIAVTDVIEPGSTFKIVAGSAALEMGIANPQTLIDVTSKTIEVNGNIRSLPGDDHKFDHAITLRQVLSFSSNRGAAQLGVRIGGERFYNYAKAFGFGSVTGFKIAGETTGMVPNPANKQEWDGLTITRLPIGHSVSATPLQIHYAMGVIASGGDLLRPQIIREIRDNNNEPVFRYDGVVVHRTISKRTADQMAAMLKYVAIKDEGTAPTAAIDGFEVAGKTGTTQKIKNGHYSNRAHVASFVGFFPASRPEVIISVIVDEATTSLTNGVSYGSAVAAPSFKRIGEKLIQYLNIKPVVEAPRPTMLVMNGGLR